MKILIVDDEQPARMRLRSMLQQLNGYEVIAEAGNGKQALEASQANAEQNAIRPEQIKLCLPDALPAFQADLVMANILAGPLKELYPRLHAHCKPGGQLILSGILADQADDVINTYQQSFDFDPVQQQEEWVFLSARRR